jgi:hypothetical protein
VFVSSSTLILKKTIFVLWEIENASCSCTILFFLFQTGTQFGSCVISYLTVVQMIDWLIDFQVS